MGSGRGSRVAGGPEVQGLQNGLRQGAPAWVPEWNRQGLQSGFQQEVQSGLPVVFQSRSARAPEWATAWVSEWASTRALVLGSGNTRAPNLGPV